VHKNATSLIASLTLIAALCAFAKNEGTVEEPLKDATQSSEFMTSVLRTSDGLPANDILDLRETADGYLWLATYQGLVRFDGLHFKSYFNTPVGLRYSTRVGPLELDASGKLWAVPDQIGAVRRDANGFSELLTNTPVLKARIASLCSDGKNNLLWVDANGVAGSFSIDKPEQVKKIPDAKTLVGSRWVRDFKGKVWMADPRGLRIYEDGVWKNVTVAGTATMIVAPRRAGGMWIARDARLRFVTEDGNEHDVSQFPWKGLSRVTCMFEDRWGRLWIGTLAQGLFCYNDGQIKQAVATANSISCLIDDEHDNVWAGTRGGGLIRLRSRQFFLHNHLTGLENEFVRSLAEDNAGRIWMSCADGRVGWWDKGQWHSLGESEGWRNYDSLCVLPASDGTVWISTIHRGVWRWVNGKMVRHKFNGPMPMEPVVDFLEDHRNRLWMVTDNSGVYCFDGKRVFRAANHGLTNSHIRALAEDVNGNIWAGDWEGSLMRLKEGRWEVMRQSSGHADAVRCLMATKDGIWVGTSNGGLLRYKDGKTVRYSMEQGLPDFCVQQLIVDNQGRMWGGTSHELFQVTINQLIEYADGKRSKVDAITYGRNDGLPDVSFASFCDPKCCRGADGQLWLATASGALHFQPSDLRESKMPQVVIDRTLLDGKPLSASDLQHLRPGAGRLEFCYTAPCLTAPERVRFRYQLVGVDPDWVDGEPTRTATYASIPAGSYSFRVMASSPEGVWNPKLATINLVVHPFFWQTNWFIALIAAVGAGGVVWLVRRATVRRLRLRVEQLHQQQAIDRERTRIAQDIHDELGANLTSIGLLADIGKRNKTISDAVTRDLGQISDTARESVAAMDAIVWALNPRNDSLDNFANYIAQFTRDFFRPTNLRTRLDLPVNLPDRPMTTEMRHQLFLIVKESFNNIVRHAEATEVNVELGCDNGHLRMVIADDGKGLTNRIAAEGQDGLVNLRERIGRIGGTVEISSKNGHGTKLEFRVPMTKTELN
jgi:signal transduction histidine kinase/ligand-binding sensor domain-containing protein